MFPADAGADFNRDHDWLLRIAKYAHILAWFLLVVGMLYAFASTLGGFSRIPEMIGRNGLPLTFSSWVTEDIPRAAEWLLTFAVLWLNSAIYFVFLEGTAKGLRMLVQTGRDFRQRLSGWDVDTAAFDLEARGRGHWRLLRYASAANIIAWIVLSLGVIRAIVHTVANLTQAAQAQPVNLYRALDSIFGILIWGAIYFVLMEGISMGLAIIAETDLNYCEQREEAEDE